MSKQNNGILRIGTSGIAVPGNKETFPAEYKLRSRLSYYASLFNTLEVNATFHKLPMASTFAKWSADVPDDFQFTIKLWREITHVKKLNFLIENIDTFYKAAAHIAQKKGCLLIQFPGSITIDYFSQVEEILSRLHELDDENKWRKAIEFRSNTWYISETYELMSNFGASMVLHDMPKSKNLTVHNTSTFAYYRFHGVNGDYRGSYNDDFLQQQANTIKTYLGSGKDVYVYFNNTMGSAFANAKTLHSMIER